MITGFADLKGTNGYFASKDMVDGWIVSNNRYNYSKLGLGTFIGNFSDEDSQLFREAISYALLNGINSIDTAINYRGMRSERDIGIVITKLIEDGLIKRNQFLISSKAGIIPGDGEIMLRPIYYMQQKLIDTGILAVEDTYMEDTLWLTMNPKFYEYALEVSRKHLNLDTIDIYYIHELELSMRHYGSSEFYSRLEGIIRAYENMVDEGKIREYGMATWEAFQLDQSNNKYISLEKVMEIARSVSENHHFKHLMIPINLQMNEPVAQKTQSYKDERLTIVECAKRFGIEIHSSGSIGQGEALNRFSVKDYLTFLVNYGNCDSYFIGSKRIEHIKENVRILESLLAE
jgi:aryl-alcohol dehydrogenase-like predicted oxidoreductase